MVGSCATDDCEIRQDRKAAAVSRNAGCRRGSWPELLFRKRRDGKTKRGCTVFVEVGAGEWVSLPHLSTPIGKAHHRAAEGFGGLS